MIRGSQADLDIFIEHRIEPERRISEWHVFRQWACVRYQISTGVVKITSLSVKSVRMFSMTAYL